MTSEYTHNDDVADPVAETQAKFWEKRHEIERLGVALYEAEDTIHGCELVIDNQKAEIANLTSELKVKEEVVRYLVKYYLDIGARRDMEIANLTGLLASTQTKLDRLETELDRLEREHARGL